MHGSAIKGANNAAPQTGMDSGVDAIEHWDLPEKVVSSRRKTSAPLLPSSLPVIILLGPTGVGKTAVSLLLAKALHSEIISADSMQIYKHMDIGTAKPSAEQQQLIRHHMIDVAEPWESFSSGAYVSHAGPVIAALLEKRRVPIIVGGAGLYIKTMTRGIFSGPSADWVTRNELLHKEAAAPGSLYARLKSMDPVAAEKIMPADARRIVRALEVCLKSGRKLSEMREESTKPFPYSFIKIGLARDRKELYETINSRVDAMIAQGLVAEVKRVLHLIKDNVDSTYGGNEALPLVPRHLPVACSSMQAIGYKEIAINLNGELNLDEAVNLIKQRSRNYAKRQFTWFKKEEGIKWVDVSGMLDPNDIFEKIKKKVPSLL
ncbi:MAG TPA: tRNA (adenosine(37)-N6)-dimethylallyltransferase MiaA, partial [Dissulfurispiraceae bacterium]|nr:tRNA (adenosine(37)-N6)-dimethylallyltransferase MiaA [Dissulfurispiraceae bacterium]